MSDLACQQRSIILLKLSGQSDGICGRRPSSTSSDTPMKLRPANGCLSQKTPSCQSPFGGKKTQKAGDKLSGEHLPHYNAKAVDVSLLSVFFSSYHLRCCCRPTNQFNDHRHAVKRSTGESRERYQSSRECRSGSWSRSPPLYERIQSRQSSRSNSHPRAYWKASDRDG